MKNIFYIQIILLFCTSVLGQTANDKIIHSDLVNPTKSQIAAENYNKGVSFAQKGDYNNAIIYYKIAIKEDRTFIDAYDNIGLAYRKINNLTEAAKYYNISYKLNNRNTSVIMNLAVLYGISKNYPKALELYKKIISLEPDNPEGYYGACRIFYYSGKSAEAIAYGKKAENLYKKTNENYVGDVAQILCIAYYNIKDYINAKKYLQIAKKFGNQIDSDLEYAIRNK
jgi:tetratricopeptide (TPR) repeat protein